MLNERLFLGAGLGYISMQWPQAINNASGGRPEYRYSVMHQIPIYGSFKYFFDLKKNWKRLLLNFDIGAVMCYSKSDDIPVTVYANLGVGADWKISKERTSVSVLFTLQTSPLKDYVIPLPGVSVFYNF